MRTLIANLKRAAWNRDTVRISGGDFRPEELKRAADLLEAALDLVPLLDRAGVLNLYIADTPEHRKLCTEERLVLSDKLQALVRLSNEE